MSNLNDKATVELFVNGEKAEAAMDRLRKKTEDLSSQIKAAQEAANYKQAKKLQRELDRTTKELSRVESASKGVGIVLNDLENTSLRGLNNALKHLRKELSMTKPDSEQWHRLSGQISAVRSRIEELNDGLRGSESLWSRFKSWSTSAWPAIDLLQQWGGNFTQLMRAAVDAYASMDQEMASVRKFTGMTAEEVEALNEKFKEIDTRSSREQLNILAQEAGRLGKSSEEDVLGYVRAADQINIALDDLGQGATLTLSKLTGVFGVEAEYGTEQSLLKVGSVVNELSQNCAASAPYLTNFAERMGGVGAQAGMTISDIMGLGAVLDSNAQKVEASATAVSQVLVRMMSDPAKYARVAGLEVDAFAEKLRTDANGALLEFLSALNQAGGMDVLSPMFKDMGENGARAITALSTLATHIDEVKSQQQAAAAAFREGTSVTEEFNVQNNTVAAALEKCKNRANELRVSLGEKLYPIMRHLLLTGSSLIKALNLLLGFVTSHKGAILSLTAATVAYTVVLKSEMLIAKAKAAIDSIHYALLVAKDKATTALTVSTTALKLAYYKLTGQTAKAAAAQTALKAAMGATPWGAILAAVSAAIAVYALWGRKLDETKEKQTAQKKMIEDVNKSAASYCAEEVSRLDALYKAATDQTKATDERRSAAEQLLSLYPDFFKNMSAEEIMLGRASTAYDNLRTSIINVARAKAAEQKIMDNQVELLELEANEADLRAQRDKDAATLKRAEGDYRYRTANRSILEYDQSSSAVYLGDLPAAQKAFNNSDAALQANLKRQQELMDNNAFLEQKFNAAPTTTPTASPSGGSSTAGGSSTGSGSAAAAFAAEKAWRERAEAEARIAYATGETTYSQYTARMAQITVDYYQMVMDATEVGTTENLKAQADYWEAVNKQTEAAAKLSLDEENARYRQSVDGAKALYARKISEEGLSADQLSQMKKVHQATLESLELQHLQRVVQCYAEGSKERADAQRKYNDAELKAQEAHLKEMADQEAKYAAIKSKYFGMNQSEKDAEFQKQFSALTEVYNQELAAVGNNEEEKLRIKQAYMDAEAALREEFNQAQAENTTNSFKGAMDAAAKWLQGEGGQALQGSLSTAVSGMSAIFSSLSTLIQAETDIQTNAIEAKYKREVKAAQGNTFLVAKLEEQKETEIAKIKNEASKKQFAMQVIMAVAQTAQNALSAYGSAASVPVVGYILAPIAAAMAVAAGAIQIAALKKQQQAAEAQGYAQGGFTRPGAVNEPAGIVHAGEWVASQKLLASPVARPMIEALDYAQRTNTIGTLRADDVSASITANNALARISETDSSPLLLVAAASEMTRTIADLNERLNEPFTTINTITGPYGIQKAQADYDKLLRNKSPKYSR